MQRRPRLLAVLAAVMAVSGLLVVGSAPAANASISWSAANPPLPANALAGQGVTLVSSSCPVDGWCIAVGDYAATTGTTPYNAALILSESGGTWSATEAPLPTGASVDPEGMLTSVSCPAVGSCTAVGRYLDATGATQALVEQLADGVWTPSAAALPGDALSTGTTTFAQLSALACPAAGACAALGVYTPSGGGEQAFVDTDTAGTWSALAAPVPAPASGSQFLGLSCPAAGACVATGTYLVSGVYLGMVDTLSGGSWTSAALPLPPGASPLASIADNDLTVSCATAVSCVVAGTTFDGNYEGVIDTLSAGTWTATAAAVPGGGASPDVQLDSVACGDAGSCVATGFATVGGVPRGLVELLSSGTWSASYVPAPDGTPPSAGIEVHDVACPTSDTCVADGQSNAGGAVTGVFWNLSGGTWVANPAPFPADAGSSPDPSFAPLTCPAAGTCLAVGTYLDSGGGRAGVVETDPSLLASTTTLAVPALSAGGVTYSATVTGATPPTGTVAFSAGLTPLCTATVVAGSATCTGPVSSTATVVGSYSGDATFAASWGTSVSPAVPVAISGFWGTWQSSRVNTWFPWQLYARVTDGNGVGVPGVVVTFSAPARGASVVWWGPATAVTNAAGIAISSVISANARIGTYTVSATAPNVPGSVGFLLTNTRR